MATVMKCENKFLAKDYEVKIAEIIAALPKIPSLHEAEPLETTEVKKPESGTIKPIETANLDVPNDALIEEVKKLVSKTNNPKNDCGRPKRQAALKQRQLIKDLIGTSTLVIKSNNADDLKKPPMHAFDYDEWLKMLEYDDD